VLVFVFTRHWEGGRTVEPKSPWRALGSLGTVGLTFVVATALGALVGYYLDRFFGTSPWLFLLCLLFGIAAGFREFFRVIAALDREGKDDGPSTPQDR